MYWSHLAGLYRSKKAGKVRKQQQIKPMSTSRTLLILLVSITGKEVIALRPKTKRDVIPS